MVTNSLLGLGNSIEAYLGQVRSRNKPLKVELLRTMTRLLMLEIATYQWTES
jgi:hypothetical protein